MPFASLRLFRTEEFRFNHFPATSARLPPAAMPSTPRLASHLICALGLALALYLTLLKLFALPCHAPGDCQKIIFSSYGTIFRLPVGLYSAALWIAALLQRDAFKRAIFLSLLALGSLGFMVIQFAVLRGFCLYCTLHALCTFAAFALHRTAPRPSLIIPLAALLAAGGFALSYQGAHSVSATPTSVSSAPRLSFVSGLPWLAPVGEKSPALILSLDCPSCLDLLEQLTSHDFTSVKQGPTLFFKTTPANRALTQEFISGILAQKDLPIRDAFLASTLLLLTQKDLVLTRPDAATQALAALLPASTTEHPLAEKILAAQSQALSAAKLPATTPRLIAPDGREHSRIDISALFHP